MKISRIKTRLNYHLPIIATIQGAMLTSQTIVSFPGKNPTIPYSTSSTHQTPLKTSRKVQSREIRSPMS